ncbi:MAG: nucleotidyl transferase AbiEii/AbiGii toxin family protein [Desulfuromonadaceae bacterium]|nr:nucleotidyl transferase AbiEii/AbiGii toxin family protein [Desulfuromonadaceae bacterium]
MQEVALAGLYRGGFFEQAAFYGGTCLRVFYGLKRFSEDLDFSLLKADPTFSLEPYFRSIKDEFNAFGFDVDISAKKKNIQSDIESAFLKKMSSIYDVRVSGRKTIRIKFEVDICPPLGFSVEEKLLIHPYSFYVKCFSLPDLFAGKMHALLFRQWKNRVKGRDWYDFEWYVKQGVELNLTHFVERASQSGNLPNYSLQNTDFLELIQQKIQQLDVDSARRDVVRFIKDPQQLEIWSQEYFLQLTQMMRFVQRDPGTPGSFFTKG